MDLNSLPAIRFPKKKSMFRLRYGKPISKSGLSKIKHECYLSTKCFVDNDCQGGNIPVHISNEEKPSKASLRLQNSQHFSDNLLRHPPSKINFQRTVTTDASTSIAGLPNLHTDNRNWSSCKETVDSKAKPSFETFFTNDCFQEQGSLRRDLTNLSLPKILVNDRQLAEPSQASSHNRTKGFSGTQSSPLCSTVVKPNRNNSINAVSGATRKSNGVKMTIQLSYGDQCRIKGLTDQITNILKSNKLHDLDENATLLIGQLEEQRRKILQNAMVEQQRQKERIDETEKAALSNAIPSVDDWCLGYPNGLVQQNVASSGSMLSGQIVQINGMPYLALPTTSPFLHSLQKPFAATLDTRSHQPSYLSGVKTKVSVQKSTMIKFPKANNTAEKTCVDHRMPSDFVASFHPPFQPVFSTICSPSKIHARLGLDKLRLCSADSKTPFCDRIDAIGRLLAYHLYNEYDIQNLLDHFERQYEKKVADWTQRGSIVANFLQATYLKQASRHYPKSEDVLIQRLLIEEERNVLCSNREAINAKFELSERIRGNKEHQGSHDLEEIVESIIDAVKKCRDDKRQLHESKIVDGSVEAVCNATQTDDQTICSTKERFVLKTGFDLLKPSVVIESAISLQAVDRIERPTGFNSKKHDGNTLESFELSAASTSSDSFSTVRDNSDSYDKESLSLSFSDVCSDSLLNSPVSSMLSKSNEKTTSALSSDDDFSDNASSVDSVVSSTQYKVDMIINSPSPKLQPSSVIPLETPPKLLLKFIKTRTIDESPIKKVPPLKIRLKVDESRLQPDVVTQPFFVDVRTMGLESSDDDSEAPMENDLPLSNSPGRCRFMPSSFNADGHSFSITKPTYSFRRNTRKKDV